MALADAAQSITKPMHGTPCSVGRLLTVLDPADVTTLASWLADTRAWSEERLYRRLTTDDPENDWEAVEVGRQSIGRHRRRQCRCFQ